MIVTDDSKSPSFQDPSLGARLARARAARGLSVEDVAAATRIRAQLIGEIERDAFDNCGGAIYARGHIRAIAQVVDADADELVADFDRRHGGLPVASLDPAALPKLATSADRDIARARRTSPRWASAAVAVLAVGVVFFGVTWFAGRDGGQPAGQTDRAAATGSTPTQAASPEPSVTASPTPTAAQTTVPPTSAPPTPTGVSLIVQVAGGPSWIQVTSSTGQRVFASVLSDGQTMQWHDPRLLTVKFGNAPVVHVVVNGQDMGTPCDRTVCTVRYPVPAEAG